MPIFLWQKAHRRIFWSLNGLNLYLREKELSPHPVYAPGNKALRVEITLGLRFVSNHDIVDHDCFYRILIITESHKYSIMLRVARTNNINEYQPVCSGISTSDLSTYTWIGYYVTDCFPIFSLSPLTLADIRITPSLTGPFRTNLWCIPFSQKETKRSPEEILHVFSFSLNTLDVARNLWILCSFFFANHFFFRHWVSRAIMGPASPIFP